MTASSEPTIFAPARIGPGTRLNGIYEIDAQLSPGGMGEIFRGHQIFSGRKVAIKFIRPELEANPDARQMFVNEGESLGEVHHDAVVRCFPLSIDPVINRLYLPMDFVEGPSLLDLMRSGPLDGEQAWYLLGRVASGLQAAHDRNIFHRDVAPDNIIVPDENCARAVIIDFGIARITRDSAVTVIGTGVAGKHNYMSPEQCGLFGGDVRAPSDIYSLGLVLAGALLGRPLDMGGSMADVTLKRQTVPNLDAVPQEWRSLLTSMLQPDPARRPQSMAALADRAPLPALRGASTILQAREEPARSAKRRPTRWFALGAFGLLLGGATAGVLYVGLRTPLPGPADHGPAKKPSPPTEQNPASDSRPTSTSEPIAAMTAFIDAYAGSPCYFAEPVTLTPESAAISAFSTSRADFEDFDKRFTERFGFSPDIAASRVWSPQCPALNFLRRTGHASDRPILLLKSVHVAQGKSLVGEVRHGGKGSVMLLQVQEDGQVVDLTSFLKPVGDADTFDIPVSRTVEKGPLPQLLVAVVSRNPAPAPIGSTDAATLFPNLLTIMDATGAPTTTAAKLFLQGPPT